MSLTASSAELHPKGEARAQFLRALLGWTLLFWAAVYALLTVRALVIRPDLPILSLAGLRALMVPIGLALSMLLFVVLEQMARWSRRQKAAALTLTVAVVAVAYFTINYHVFHRPEFNVGPAPEPLIKIASYLIEFFWIFPAWVLLYLFLRHRALSSARRSPSDAGDGIWVKDGRGQVRVTADAIRWVEAERDYVRIHTEERSHLVRSTMAKIEAELERFHFLRIHRAVIVPVRLIEGVRRQSNGRVAVTLTTGETLPAGRAYLPRLREIVGNGSGVHSQAV